MNMGDKETLAKARRELEDLYLGIPDESVNLTFQDLAQVKQPLGTTGSSKSLERKLSAQSINPRRDAPVTSSLSSSALTKLPSLDFNRAFEASNNHRYQDVVSTNDYRHSRVEEQALHGRHSYGGQHHDHGADHDLNSHGHHHHRHHHDINPHQQGHHQHHNYGHNLIAAGHHHHHAGGGHGDHHQPAGGYSSRSSIIMGGGFDDTSSHMSGISMQSSTDRSFQGAGGARNRRRPGVPHSNICTICSIYIYMFRHRCLVCGRVYCRQCVSIGMGEMTEGRKCIECLGKRFSQRYIERAGNVGCWRGWCMGYPATAKLEEIKWAEKGPRKSGTDNNSITTGHSRYNNNSNSYAAGGAAVLSRSLRSPRTPTSAGGHHLHNHNHSSISISSTTTPPSFVATSSPYSSSPFSPANYHLPL